MRLAFGISLILLGVLWLAATFDVRQPAQIEAAHWKDAPAGTKWRRTAGGWQRAEQVVSQTARARSTTPHPMVVATFQLLVSVLALAVLPANIKKRSAETTSYPRQAKTTPTVRRTQKASHRVTC